MREYKRITKEKATSENTKPCYDNNGNIIMSKELFELFIEEHNQLRQIENLIENGTLIELPCKVGDTVYEIYKNCSKCSHFKETGWEYDCWCDFDGEEYKNMFEFDGDNDCIYIIEEIKFDYPHIQHFGKTVFLTKSEAEAKLKELQNK